MSTIRVYSVANVVVFEVSDKGEEQRFIGMTPSQAHDHVTAVIEAISTAKGNDDALNGRIKDPDTCPRCKARSITPRHECRRLRA